MNLKEENEKILELLRRAWRLMPGRNYHEDFMQSEYNAWQIEAAEVLNAADSMSQQNSNEVSSPAQDEREAFKRALHSQKVFKLSSATIDAAEWAWFHRPAQTDQGSK